MDQANNLKEVRLSESDLFPNNNGELCSLYDARFFREVASLVAKTLQPRKVLDAGCAFGLLVEAFWHFGIECWGIDISPYAIQNTKTGIRPYCRVGDIAREIGGSYDLITCLEVLDHMPADSALAAVELMCRCTDAILFSSISYHLSEPRQFNGRSTMYWLTLFHNYGFEPDLLFDASAVACHAMLLRRRAQPWPTEVLQTFANLLDLRRAALAPSDTIPQTEQAVAEAEARFEAVLHQGHLEHVTELKTLQQVMEDLARALDTHLHSAKLKEHSLTELIAKTQRALDMANLQNQELACRLTSRIDELSQRVDSIQGSRIWKALVWAGGILLRLSGRRPGP